VLLFRLGLLPRGGLGEDRLGVIFEHVAAAGAADPVGLALVANLNRAAALGNELADSVHAPRTRPRWTCPTPRHEPTSGAYAFSASWSARRPGETLCLSSTARTVTATAATTPSAANRPMPDETLVLRIVDWPP
jgi:hypothetical protein